MKNIHILPADKPSRLSINYQTNLLQLGLENRMFHDNINIYITSDEYIGLSYYLDGNLVRKGVVDDKDYWEVRKDYKKIILTTDQDLIKDGVQAIDDDFLEWFVKNPNCEEVEIKPLLSNNGRALFSYKIIIPKEEPKQGALNHFLSASNVIVKDPQISNFNKQETLEEAAQKFYPSTTTDFICSPKLVRDGFIAGAKWQQERSYNEEEVEDLLLKVGNILESSSRVSSYTEKRIKEWLFEQFKKK